MKLLFVGTDRDRGGGAAHFLSMMQAMAGAGHHVEALADRTTYIAASLQESGLTWHHARFRNALSPAAHRVLARTIRRMQPDWMIGNFGKEYWPLIAQGRLHGIPVALFRHRMPVMHRVSQYLLPRLAQRFITVSRYVHGVFVERGMPADRVQVLYNPVDTTACRPDPDFGRELRHALDIPGDAVVVGFVGRMYAGKGLICLQQALDRAMGVEPRLHALWIGEGPQLEDLRQAILAGPQAQRHHLAGWRADAWHCYSAMSMLAFPSIMPETFGRVSIEAQATGIPVLCSDIGGVPETLQDGKTGLLLPPRDVASWCEAILALCDDGRRQRMGASARSFVEQRFSMPVIAEAFARLLQDPAGEPPARPDQRPD